MRSLASLSTVATPDNTLDLRGLKLFGLFALCVLLAAAVPVSAQPSEDEVFYLSCSDQEVIEPLPGDDDNLVTRLYEVTVDALTNEAVLEEIAVSPFNQADAIACDQSGRCYMIDRLLNNNPDLEDGGFIEEYVIGNPNPVNISDTVLTDDTLGFPSPLQGIVLAAFHPDGTLYAASQDDDRLYVVDLDRENDLANPTADPVGLSGAIMFDGSVLDIRGADLVFTADHRAFLWTNGLTPGLYELFLPPDGASDTTAVQLEGAQDLPNPDFSTGLSVRDFGAGNLMVSSTLDEVTEHTLGDGSLVDTFAMASEEGFDHRSGDMAHTFNCLLRCGAAPSAAYPGESVTIDIELFHNTARTARQAFEMEIIDPAGQVVYQRATGIQRFDPGSTMAYNFDLPVPMEATPGEHTIRLGVAGMQQGEAVAECTFNVETGD